MTITVKLDSEQVGKQFKFGVQRFADRAAKAAQVAARRAAEEIVTEGRKDIKSAGDFGSSRWQQGLQAKISFKSRSDINIRITHAVFYWKVFEFGAVIRGKPLLWIPLSFAKDAQGVRARDYPGRLFRVDRKHGAPLLMTNNGGKAQAKYFGKEKVTIPKKFHLRTIAARITRKLNKYYREAFKNGR